MPDARTDRLATIRRRHAEASTDWQYQFGHEGETVTARVIPAEEPYIVFTLSKQCTYPDREFASNIHADQTFLLELLDETFNVVRQLRQALERRQPKPTNYAAECAIKCKQDAEFRMFMQVEFGVESDDPEKVENRVKTLLGIASKKKLDTDPRAAKEWRDLVDRFNAWNKRRTGR